MAGVRKGRGREFGRETAPDGGGVGNLGMRLRAREGREFRQETAREGGGVGNLGMRLRAMEEG